MAIQPEISQLDSSEKKVSPKDKLFQKTNTEMSEVFESELEASSSSFIIDKIIELNPDVEIKTDSNKSVIFSSVSIDKLVLPE